MMINRKQKVFQHLLITQSINLKSYQTRCQIFHREQKNIITAFIDMNNGVGSLGRSIEGLSSIMGGKAQQSLAGFKAELDKIQQTLVNWIVNQIN